MKKHMMLTLLFPCLAIGAHACDACKKQQSKFWGGLGHGPGPESRWDYLIVALMTLFTLYVLFASLKYLIRPNERNDDHIKRMILNDFNP